MNVKSIIVVVVVVVVVLIIIIIIIIIIIFAINLGLERGADPSHLGLVTLPGPIQGSRFGDAASQKLLGLVLQSNSNSRLLSLTLCSQTQCSWFGVAVKPNALGFSFEGRPRPNALGSDFFFIFFMPKQVSLRRTAGHLTSYKLKQNGFFKSSCSYKDIGLFTSLFMTNVFIRGT